MSTTMNPADHLAIERLVHESWWNTDLDAAAGAEKFFTADATVVMPARTMRGHAEIKAGNDARVAHGPRLSRHLVINLLVDGEGPDRAVAFYALLLFAKNGVAPQFVPSYSALGETRDTVVRKDGAWLIEKRELMTAFLSPDNDSVMLGRGKAGPAEK